MRPAQIMLFLLSALLHGAPAPAQVAPERRNWFNDPFFQISAAIPDCPLPAGPYMTAAERRSQAHSRAERGTTCWLTGDCDRPNAYAYDQDIARAFRDAFRAQYRFMHTTLWVTVQARIVFIEGCVRHDDIAPELEAFARTIPQVQQAAALVYSNPAAHPPYTMLTSP
jgi:hypothetical protein